MENKKAQEFYGNLAEGNGDKYLAEARRFIPPYDAIAEMVTNALQSISPTNILDVGSGVGNIEEIILKKIPGAQITCVEVSPEMARASRERLSHYGDQVTLLNMNILDFEPEQGFDAILSNIALHNIPYDRKESLMRNIKGWLKPKGTFIWSDLIRYDDEEIQKSVTDQRLKFAMANGATEEFARRNFEKEGKHDYPLTEDETFELLARVGFDSIMGTKQSAFAIFRAMKK